LSVPTDHGVRSNEHEMVAPPGTDLLGQDPEQLVPPPDLGTRTRAKGHRQLMAEEDVLDYEVLAVAEEANEDVEEVLPPYTLS
jgi:hypothetical protein